MTTPPPEPIQDPDAIPGDPLLPPDEEPAPPQKMPIVPPEEPARSRLRRALDRLALLRRKST
jgi:hypothetical protein